MIGRAARHGDPGSAERLLSLDDTLFAEALPALWRRLAQRCAKRGVVPLLFARPLAAAAQTRAEWRERALRQHLRRSDEQSASLYAFFGGRE